MGITLFLSTSAWAHLSPPIECRETRQTAKHPCSLTVWRKKVTQSSTLNCANLAHNYCIVECHKFIALSIFTNDYYCISLIIVYFCYCYINVNIIKNVNCIFDINVSCG